MVGKKPKEESFTVGDEEALEDSEYSVKGDFSKAELIQKHLARCLELRSKDMRPGYTTYVQGKPEVIPDSRKEYCGSIEALKNVLSPELATKQPQIKEEWIEAKKVLFDKYAYNEREKKVDNPKDPYNPIWEYSGRKFLPQKAAPIMCDHPQYPKSTRIIYIEGIWDIKINAYWDEMVLYCDELFEKLNDLIHELDYFKGKSAW